MHKCLNVEELSSVVPNGIVCFIDDPQFRKSRVKINSGLTYGRLWSMIQKHGYLIVGLTRYCKIGGEIYTSK